jgi:YHS domain-containing protein
MRLHGSLRLGIAALALLGAAGCGTLADFFTAGSTPMLRGYDPVSYYTIGRPVKCAEHIRVEHLGGSYCFANDANRRMFLMTPERYVPRFGGFSANAMVYSLPVESDPLVFKIIDGKLHVFDSARAKRYFEMDQERNLKLAEHYWENEVRDANQLFHHLKRTLFRVPHYRSEAELAAEYQKRYGRDPG